MAALNGDDDQRRPPPDGIVSLPAPWGDVVIPDDVSELAEEAAWARRRLRHERQGRRGHRWGSWGLRDSSGNPTVVGPILVVFLALTLAMASLFGGAWPASPNGEQSDRSPRASAGTLLPNIALTDASGATVRLRSTAPAIILSIGRCECANLINEATAVAGESELPLLVVGQPTAPTLPQTAASRNPDAARALSDPQDALARAVAPDSVPERGSALVVLLAGDASMRQVMTDVRSAEEFAAGAAQLR